MKRSLILVTICLLALLSSQANAFERQSQKEFFCGFAMPLAPDVFKNYYKVGLSAHGQYVIFPHRQLGISFGGAFEFFTFDGDKFIEDFIDANWDYYWYYYGLDLYDVSMSADGNARFIELGLGLRPYLTPVTSSMQIFLFGMGTFNFTTNEITIKVETEEETVEANENKMGIAAGAGLEMPAGSINLILQGLIRFVFTEGETTSFIGFTTGIVF